MFCVLFQISTNAAVQHPLVVTTIKRALIHLVVFSVSVMTVSTDQNASTVSLLIIDIMLSRFLGESIVFLIVSCVVKWFAKHIPKY